MFIATFIFREQLYLRTADGRPIKMKPKAVITAKRNERLIKALQPKNAIMCLNELKSGLKYATEPVTNIGSCCVSVEVSAQHPLMKLFIA